MSENNTPKRASGGFLSILLILIGLAAVALGLTGAGKMASAYVETVELSRQQQGRWMGSTGGESSGRQLQRWRSLVYAGLGMSALGLIMGVHHLQTRAKSRPPETSEDPDFADRP